MATARVLYYLAMCSGRTQMLCFYPQSQKIGTLDMTSEKC